MTSRFAIRFKRGIQYTATTSHLIGTWSLPAALSVKTTNAHPFSTASEAYAICTCAVLLFAGVEWLAYASAHFNSRYGLCLIQGTVVQNPINGNPRLHVNQGVYFSTTRCCSTLMFGKTLPLKKSMLKKINKQKKTLPKVENVKQKFTLILD